MWTGREGDENKEATWEEFSDFYKTFYRNITVSEFDRPHKTVVFCSEQDIPPYEVNGCSDIPQINFLSQYYILTHQGIFTSHFFSFLHFMLYVIIFLNLFLLYVGSCYVIPHIYYFLKSFIKFIMW